MKTILKLAALAIIALTVLTSCSKETESITETTESPTIDKGKSSDRYGYNPGFDLSEVTYVWKRISSTANIANITASNSSNTYGYATDGNVYKYDGYTWNQINGRLKYDKYNGAQGTISISASDDGNSIWGISSDGKPCKWNGTAWTNMLSTYGEIINNQGKDIRQISAGNNDQVWFTNRSYEAYHLNNGRWEKETVLNHWGLEIYFREVAVSPDGQHIYATMYYTGNNDAALYKLEENHQWVKVSNSSVIKCLTVSNNEDIWGIDIFDYPVKKQGNNWLVMGDKMSSVTISADGKDAWGTKDDPTNINKYKIYKFHDWGYPPVAPTNNPNNKYTAMNRALMDSTLKCFGKSNWQTQMANFNTVAGKTAIRDLYIGAYDQAIAKGTLTKYASLFVGGIDGTEYNNFVTSMRAVTLQSMNISLELTPPPSAVLLSPAADALQKEITEWRGNGNEEEKGTYPGYYTLTDLRNFLTAENSKIATANITEAERSMLYGFSSLRWEVETYLTSSVWENKANDFLFSQNSKAKKWTFRGCFRAMLWGGRYGLDFYGTGYAGYANTAIGCLTAGDGSFVISSLGMFGGAFGAYAGWAMEGDNP